MGFKIKVWFVFGVVADGFFSLYLIFLSVRFGYKIVFCFGIVVISDEVRFVFIIVRII